MLNNFEAYFSVWAVFIVTKCATMLTCFAKKKNKKIKIYWSMPKCHTLVWNLLCLSEIVSVPFKQNLNIYHNRSDMQIKCIEYSVHAKMEASSNGLCFSMFKSILLVALFLVNFFFHFSKLQPFFFASNSWTCAVLAIVWSALFHFYTIILVVFKHIQ